MTHWQSGMRLTPARLGEQESGTVDVPIVASTFGTAVVNFSQAFAAPPHVRVTIVSGSGSVIRATVFVTTLSATSMTVRVDLNASATVTPVVHWEATL